MAAVTGLHRPIAAQISAMHMMHAPGEVLREPGDRTPGLDLVITLCRSIIRLEKAAMGRWLVLIGAVSWVIGLQWQTPPRIQKNGGSLATVLVDSRSDLQSDRSL